MTALNSIQKNIIGIGKFHWIGGIILSILVLSWIIYQQWLVNNPLQLVNVPLDYNCDLRAGPCETVLDDGSRVSFAIEPRTIPISETLTLEVTVSGLDVDAVSVDINGVDMKMPPNIINLQQTGNGRFGGKAALSFCTRSIMEWESVIQLEAGNQKIKIPYRFITSKESY